MGSNTNDTRLQDAVELAQMAFFEKLAEAYPEIKTGDFRPEDYAQFNEASLTAGKAWLDANNPLCGDHYMIDYPVRNAPAVGPASPHYPFYCTLKEGGRVLRNDSLSHQTEWLTLDHPGIQGNAGNVVYFGYMDLSLEQDLLSDCNQITRSKQPGLT